MRFLVKPALLLAVAFVMSACGDGTDYEEPAATTMSLESDAPANNLDMLSSSGYVASTTAASCGYAVPSKTLSGTVNSVYDGDTITVGTTKVRLDSIDAPELSQAYGQESKNHLAGMVKGKHVRVYYAKVDKYGRTVGQVFTDDCTYANLRQVSSGSAWHYKQYQCEQPADLRSAFASAQAVAEAADLGLWATSAVAPWVYRNGTDPAVPTCESDSPTWVSSSTSTSTSSSSSTSTSTSTSSSTSGSSSTSTSTSSSSSTSTSGSTSTSSSSSGSTSTSTSGSSSGSTSGSTSTSSSTSGSSTYTSTSTCYMVYVSGYTRSDGTKVRSYYRRSPGCA